MQYNSANFIEKPKNIMISSNIENEGNEDIYGSNST